MRNPLVLLPFALMAASGSSAAESARIEIVLDVSGSMRSSLGSEVKIEAAKSAIRQTVAGIPDGSVVALRYYGHRVAQERKDESCRDTELVVQFQPLDKPRFLGALDKAVPRGQTPIAYSLQQAAQDFGAPSDEERAMILVSDGIETCGGDPLATVRDLMAKGFKVKVHTIGFDVDAAARAQLEAISGATGGEYFDARSASALAETLGKLTQRALLIKRDSAFGEEVRGGAKYEEAVAIKPATVYHLDHHQREDEYDYFVVEARDGQKIVASIQAVEKGVTIRGDKFQKSGMRYTGIAIHAPDQRALVDKWVANPGEKATEARCLGKDDRSRGLRPRRGQGEGGRGGEPRSRGAAREHRVPVLGQSLLESGLTSRRRREGRELLRARGHSGRRTGGSQRDGTGGRRQRQAGGSPCGCNDASAGAGNSRRRLEPDVDRARPHGRRRARGRRLPAGQATVSCRRPRQ